MCIAGAIKALVGSAIACAAFFHFQRRQQSHERALTNMRTADRDRRRSPTFQPVPRSAFARFLREPLLHFTLIGALIFAVNAWRAGRVPVESSRGRIDINAGTVAWLREGFSRQWHRAPDADELRGLVND